MNTLLKESIRSRVLAGILTEKEGKEQISKIEGEEKQNEETIKYLKEQQAKDENPKPLIDYFKVPVQNEPKLYNNFELIFPEETGIPSYMVQTFEKPKFKASIKENHNPEYNTYEITGGSWLPIKVKILENIDNSTLKGVQHLIKNKFNMKLNELDGPECVLNTWLITECRVVSVDYGNLDYGNDDLSMITVEIKPKNCKVTF